MTRRDKFRGTSWDAFLAAVPLAVLLTCSIPVHASNLVLNGGFELTTAGKGQLGYNTSIIDWTNATNAYNFVFTPGSADTTGAMTQYGVPLKLWGPGDGSANGLPATSPDGGNFVAADGAYHTGPISQTITGLTIGDIYAVSFWWAGAQQLNYTSANTEQWKVTLGGTTQSTAILDNASKGFTGWQFVTFDYTATSTTEMLSFLAAGTPSGVPPFSLLDGVSVTNTSTPPPTVPEPGDLLLLGAGMSGLALVGLKNRFKRNSRAL